MLKKSGKQNLTFGFLINKIKLPYKKESKKHRKNVLCYELFIRLFTVKQRREIYG